MDGLFAASDKEEIVKEFSFKDLFVPLTTGKAIIWIIVVGLIVYLSMLFNDFVWDDKVYILFNIDIHAINFFYLFGPNSFNNISQYRPIVAIFFAFLYSIFHDSPFFYHFFNLGLHITNTILVFYFLKHFFKKELVLIASLFFLIHPMQVESVSLATSVDNLLFFFFGMMSILIFLKEKINNKKLVLGVLMLLLSLLSKETGALFLVVILAYRIFYLKKLINFKILAGFTMAFAFYFLLRFGVGHIYFTNNDYRSIAQLPLSLRLINIPAIFLYYIKTFFFPVTLAINQQWVITSITVNSFYIPVILIVCFFSLVASFAFSIRNNIVHFKTYIFFLMWFLIGLLFHSQIFPLDVTVADRFFYFSIVGLLGMLCVMYQIGFSEKNFRIAALYTSIIILAVFSVRTFIRNGNWQNEITLYTHDLKIHESADIENNLGVDYLNNQNYEEALNHFKKSASLSANEGNLSNLGLAYEKLGNLQLAEKNFQKSLIMNKYPPRDHKTALFATSVRLSYLYLLEHKDKIAYAFIKSKLQIYPTNGYLWEYLAISEYRLNKKQDSLTDIQTASTYSSEPEIGQAAQLIKNNKTIILAP